MKNTIHSIVYKDNIYHLQDATVPKWARKALKPKYTAKEVNAVPAERTINGYSLNEDIKLSIRDIDYGLAKQINNYYESDVHVRLHPNVVNKFYTPQSLIFEFSEDASDGFISDGENEYKMIIQCGDVVPSIEFRANGKLEWVNGRKPIMKSGYTYEISITLIEASNGRRCCLAAVLEFPTSILIS